MQGACRQKIWCAGQRVAVAHWRILSVDIKIRERTAVEHIVGNELGGGSKSYCLQPAALLERCRRYKPKIRRHNHFLYATVEKHGLTYLRKIVGQRKTGYVAALEGVVTD